MILRGEVLAVETCGDAITVKMQATANRQAEWRPILSWTVQLPEHIARRLCVGDTIHLVFTKRGARRTDAR